MNTMNKSTRTPSEIVAAAATWARDKVGCEYSQARRLQENTFDCSSLVARANIAQGIEWYYCGPVPLSTQEVYEDCFELLWPSAYAEIGKRLGGKDVIAKAKQPGDLQFLCTDSSTTRANRITHVAMVASDKEIVHARGKAYGVCINDINHYAGKVCAVTRYNPNCTLRKGMKGHRTLALQRKLAEKGYNLSADGDYGAKTMDAVKAFQKSAGLPVSGQADSATLASLGLAAASEIVIELPSSDTATAPDAPDGRVTITGETVNIRTGPGTEYPIVKVARKGETYDVYLAWLPILLDGEVRWVSAKYSSYHA